MVVTVLKASSHKITWIIPFFCVRKFNKTRNTVCLWGKNAFAIDYNYSQLELYLCRHPFTYRTAYCRLRQHESRLCVTLSTCQHSDMTDRFCLFPLYVLWKSHSDFILRTPRSALDVHQPAWQTHAPHSHHPSSLTACPARQKKPSYCMSAVKALSSPSNSTVCTPTPTYTRTPQQARTHTRITETRQMNR